MASGAQNCSSSPPFIFSRQRTEKLSHLMKLFIWLYAILKMERPLLIRE